VISHDAKCVKRVRMAPNHTNFLGAPSKFEGEVFALHFGLEVRDRFTSANDRDVVSVSQIHHLSISIHLSRVKTVRLLRMAEDSFSEWML
jgi:hypothetical protein